MLDLASLFSRIQAVRWWSLLRINGARLLVRGASRSLVVPYSVTRIEYTSKKQFDISPGSRLLLNKSWTGKSPFPFYLTMGERSTITVRGNFTFYEGGHIGLSEGAVLELGHGYANRNINISCRQRIRIGDGCLIGPNVVIRDADDHEILPAGSGMTVGEVHIGDRVWIGTNVIILKGVTIGTDSVIAAGSVVTRDVPPNTLVAGVPARPVRHGIKWQ